MLIDILRLGEYLVQSYKADIPSNIAKKSNALEHLVQQAAKALNINLEYHGKGKSPDFLCPDGPFDLEIKGRYSIRQMQLNSTPPSATRNGKQSIKMFFQTKKDKVENALIGLEKCVVVHPGVFFGKNYAATQSWSQRINCIGGDPGLHVRMRSMFMVDIPSDVLQHAVGRAVLWVPKGLMHPSPGLLLLQSGWKPEEVNIPAGLQLPFHEGSEAGITSRPNPHKGVKHFYDVWGLV